MEEKILEVLKPKAASFGFTQDELKSVAKSIADNLSLKEDATDEETAEAVSKAVEGVLPILKLSQSAMNRVIESKKAKEEKKPLEEKQPKEEKKSGEDEPAWFKAYRESQEKRIAELEQGKRNENYSKRAKERFKDMDEDFRDLGMEGKTFQNDDEFETFASNLESKWAAYSQKLSDKGLRSSAKPTKGGGKGGDELPEGLKERIEDNAKDKPSPVMGI